MDIETTGFDPNIEKIISIQFQQINSKTGKTLGDLTILKEWESTEKEILTKFIDKLNPKSNFSFIPIGFNLSFEFKFLKVKSQKLLKIDLENFLYHDMPKIDIKDTYIMMRENMFKGSSLDSFVGKKWSNSMVPKWYREENYKQIEMYIEDETNRFMDGYQFLRKHLPTLLTKYKE
ncbi:MAG: hypothetical protein IH840_04725 [Candidatus Heimdallarchaeota archaeon]|nr:hypothetical protein [Candidatus Heimdallarchaeota archaeon]